MKLNTLLFLLMLIFVPLAGELNIHPFDNTFRLSFGTPVFFLSVIYTSYSTCIIGSICRDSSSCISYFTQSLPSSRLFL